MTATDVPHPTTETAQAIVDSALERIAGATDFLEFEQAWIEGLRGLHGSGDCEARSLILAAAGKRLNTFDNFEDDIPRRHWLRDLVEEVQVRGNTSLSQELLVVASEELHAGFTSAGPKISELRAALTAGESLREFATRCPLAADHIRDLGRSAEGLRGTGVLTLCSEEDCDIARGLARAMKPKVHLVSRHPS